MGDREQTSNSRGARGTSYCCPGLTIFEGGRISEDLLQSQMLLPGKSLLQWLQRSGDESVRGIHALALSLGGCCKSEG